MGVSRVSLYWQLCIKTFYRCASNRVKLTNIGPEGSQTIDVAVIEGFLAKGDKSILLRPSRKMRAAGSFKISLKDFRSLNWTVTSAGIVVGHNWQVSCDLASWYTHTHRMYEGITIGCNNWDWWANLPDWSSGRDVKSRAETLRRGRSTRVCSNH